MSELAAFIRLGFRHITDLQGADHILFLLALSAIYRFRDWRNVLWVVTAFTAGHSLTLGLAVTGLLRVPTPVIEFLIPVTIVLTGIENVLARDRVPGSRASQGRYRPMLAAVFGLVHGAGFANYLQSLFVERIALPLFGFNVGIELGQLLVLVLTFVAYAAMDLIVARVRPNGWRLSTVRLRAIAVSAMVVVVATRWAAERAPW
jgi:hypothetical protein